MARLFHGFGEGSAVVIRERSLFDKQFYARVDDFAASSAPARGKGYHQDSPIPDSGEIPAGTGRQQLAQNITGNGIGALAATRTVQGAHRKPDGRFDGRR